MQAERKRVLSVFESAEQTIYYLLDTQNGAVGMTVLPSALKDHFTLDGNWSIESLVQVKLVGDSYPSGYSQGMTLRNSASAWALKYVSQQTEEDGDLRRVVTTLRSERITALHTLTLRSDAPYMTVETSVTNTSEQPQKLELLSSFSLCDLSAADGEERMRDLRFMRLQSRWSGEGKLCMQSLNDLHMEPSWLRIGVNALRYGQVGSMPVRGWFPWGVMEDTRYGWCVGAQLYHPGSWQMELYNVDDKVAFSGGLADRELGHFLKTLAPGETLDAPKAVLAAAMGDVDMVSWRLTCAQEEALRDAPEPEWDLPVLFNEYCTTWGDPSLESVRHIAQKLKGHGFRYFVIDCGWYANEDGVWYNTQGDWTVNAGRFPNGLKEAADVIREAGMIPGLWFELECLGEGAEAYRALESLQLKRDGVPISDGGKRFFDMKLPETVAYLDERVIRQLKDNGFGYIKVDYNGNYGIGADGGESFGEELRKSVLASRDYFKRLREAIPDIVIENCASGGHRLEPSMMAVSSMASFSDAHECEVIPVIAANLHRAILPCQSQIWAVLRATDSARRLTYSLANGFLGRLCASGDIFELAPWQWEIVDSAVAFYAECAPVIRHGITTRIANEGMDYNHLEGTQIVLRKGLGISDGLLLAVIHQFDEPRAPVEAPLSDGQWRIRGSFAEPETLCSVEAGRLVVRNMQAMSATVVLLER